MMDYRIEYEISAILILVILMVYFLVKPRRFSKQLNLFIFYCAAVFFINITDMATVILGWHHTVVPLWLLYGTNALYLSLGFMLPCLLAQYVFVAVGKRRNLPWLMYVPALVGIFSILIINPFTGLFMSFSADGSYVRGPFNALELIVGIIYLVISLGYVLRSRQSIARETYYTILATILINVVLGGIQALMPAYLLTGLGGTLTVAVIYLSVQSYNDQVDSLTGLPSVEAFYLDVRRLLYRKDNEPLCIIVMDIQRFSTINMLLGWKKGNDFLIRIGQSIQQKIDLEWGSYARMESDHFVICLPLRLLEENKQQIMDNPDLGESRAFPIVLTYGVYVIDDPNLPVALMCDRVLLALNTVKQNYIGRMGWYTAEMGEHQLAEQKILADKESALAKEEFIIQLQPVFDIEKNCLASAEALLRWHHPVEGLIPPNDFIPLFEKNWFIRLLDHYTFNACCAILADWRNRELPMVPISVNLSQVNFYNVNLGTEMKETLSQHGISQELIHIEVTESTYMEEPEKMMATIKELQADGFVILLDDFGSGYSSLNALKDIPVDILKIDLEFLRGFEENDKAEKILSAVIHMAQALGLPMVVEGIDSEGQLAFLKYQGCEFGQGYYYAKPLSLIDFEGMLQSNLCS
ncbi:EAL domain-containing protein [Eubacterium aggregans]|uniref:EAL domain-containing protein n=1 Tax=Eubacterium aggregans TaxID=81409 RepID=UPI003F3C6481